MVNSYTDVPDEMDGLQEEVWDGMQECKVVEALEDRVTGRSEKKVEQLQTLPAVVCHGV